MATGWVKLHRKVLKSRYGGNLELLGFWVYLLLQAHHGEDPIYDGFGNKIKRGQFSTGILRIARETKMHRSKVQRFLKKLEIDNQIKRQSTNKCSIITITNWNKFQGVDRQGDNPAIIQRYSSDNPAITEQECKELKNEKNKYIDQIGEIYLSYPRKIGKAKGIKKLTEQIKSDADINRLNLAVKNYNIEVFGRPKDKIMHFSTFSNEIWKDYAEYKTDQAEYVDMFEEFNNG